MRKQIMKKTSAAVAMMVAAMMASGAMSALMSASAAGNSAFPYTMFAGSGAEGALTINAKHFCINGSIASNGTIATGKRGNLNGKKTEYAGVDMPYSGDQLANKYFSRAQVVDELIQTKKNNVNLNQTMDVAGEAYLSGNVNMNASLRADSDIYIDGNVANCNNAVLYSEFGDIIIDTNNFNFTGLIYAPLGDVIITANNINLNNVVVVADTITLNANNVNANYNRSGADVIGSGSETKASYITKFNSYMMDKEAETVLDMLSQYYTVTPIDAGEFANIGIAAPLAPGMIVNMDFVVDQYLVEGYGNLSIMKTDGVQQMSTIVLTPFDKDMPLISTDYMFMGESRISYIEFYGLGVNGDENMPVFNDLAVLKDRYAQYMDTAPTPGWFDEVRTMGLFKVSTYQDDAAISQMLYDSIRITMDASVNAPVLDPATRDAKHVIVQNYVDNLIANPGVSTAIFNMCLGPQVTTTFFNNVFFGTGLYQ